jgi:hypothetical protein
MAAEFCRTNADTGGVIQISDLPDEIRSTLGVVVETDPGVLMMKAESVQPMADVECEHLERTLRKTHGTQIQTAGCSAPCAER